MTIPQFSLLAFALWTICVPLGAVGYYRWSRILTGSAAIHQFPADGANGSDWYRRATRAHANCVENLPVFGAIVFVESALGSSGTTIDALALTVFLARVVQTTVHVAWLESARTVSVRFSFYLVQMLCMLALAFELLASAGVHS